MDLPPVWESPTKVLVGAGVSQRIPFLLEPFAAGCARAEPCHESSLGPIEPSLVGQKGSGKARRVSSTTHRASSRFCCRSFQARAPVSGSPSTAAMSQLSIAAGLP
jgi:hypothetical protein